MYILKFGGTSLADASKIKDAVNIVRGYIPVHGDMIIVISAMAGVTDKLVNICESISSQSGALKMHYRNLNKSILQSSGKYCLFCNSLQQLLRLCRSAMNCRIL